MLTVKCSLLTTYQLPLASQLTTCYRRLITNKYLLLCSYPFFHTKHSLLTPSRVVLLSGHLPSDRLVASILYFVFAVILSVLFDTEFRGLTVCGFLLSGLCVGRGRCAFLGLLHGRFCLCHFCDAVLRCFLLSRRRFACLIPFKTLARPDWRKNTRRFTTHCHLRQQSDHVRTHNTVSTSR